MRQWEGWVGCEVWGTLTFVRGKKKTCSPVKSDAVKCEIAAKSCQMLLQVVIGSGEEEEVKKKKNNLSTFCSTLLLQLVCCQNASLFPDPLPSPFFLARSPLFWFKSASEIVPEAAGAPEH